MPLTILGYLAASWMLGMLIADGLPSKRKVDAHGFSCGVSYCVDRLAMKPWPFRVGKERECPRKGDVNRCTGETFNGRWWHK